MQRAAEVIIVGAGPVGLFAALRLGQAGITTTVLEKESGISQLPRACMYYPQVQFALRDAGIWSDIITGGGFRTTGLDIRLPPVSDGKGGKIPGQLVANFPEEPAFDPKVDAYGPPVDPPHMSMLNMPQVDLANVLLKKALETQHVQVHFNKELIDILDGPSADSVGIRITVRHALSDTKEEYTGSYLVGADGGRSKTRALLQVPFPGHTWPEKLIATDVWLPNNEGGPKNTTLLMHNTQYVILSPLSPPVPGEISKWRVTFAVDPEELKTNPIEHFTSDEYVSAMYDRVWVGPRPISWKIDRISPYTIHQRLAATLKRGRCLLLGDAAHLNNVIGGLGLSNCLLDAVSLSDALILTLREGKPSDAVLNMYSDERRQVFQFFIDPVSSWSKLRVQSGETDDWFFRALNDTSSPAFANYINTLQNVWPTHIREMAQTLPSRQAPL
ncbi:rRNA bioproteinsis protein rrp5 [Sphaceloma murrayae]|uniref:rRNA bioproteinsis protein rrp5 n=1 Tax=Sphaceloma murrayae TaxID=2082308 RepID=A0A2K1R2X9_9PEZI|nr:rRNA bioproteinsis protein rrp5 [Sphaceloma murrayae]